MFGKEVSSEVNEDLRRIGKTLNFAISFGAGGPKVAEQAGVSRKQGDEFVAMFFKSYPGLKKYFKACHASVKQKGYVLIDPILKRRAYMPLVDYDRFKVLHEYVQRHNNLYPQAKINSKVWSEYSKISGNFERASQNFSAQGTAASILKYATSLIYQDTLKKNLLDDFKLVCMVHDEFVYEVKDSLLDEAFSTITELADKSAKLFCKRLDIPCKITISKF